MANNINDINCDQLSRNGHDTQNIFYKDHTECSPDYITTHPVRHSEIFPSVGGSAAIWNVRRRVHQIRLIHAGIQPESEGMLHLSLGGEVRQLTDTDHVHRSWTAEVHVQ